MESCEETVPSSAQTPGLSSLVVGGEDEFAPLPDLDAAARATAAALSQPGRLTSGQGTGCAVPSVAELEYQLASYQQQVDQQMMSCDVCSEERLLIRLQNQKLEEEHKNRQETIELLRRQCALAEQQLLMRRQEETVQERKRTLGQEQREEERREESLRTRRSGGGEPL